MEQKSSNYEILKEKWKKDFTGWDHEAMCRKLRFPVCTEEEIRLPYFGKRFRISRKTGDARQEGREEEPSFNTYMAIFHLLYYSSETPENSGEWIPFRNVKKAGVFEAAYEKQVLLPFAEAFSGELEDFIKAGEELGFQKLSFGDASFLAPAFPCIPIQVIFWDGDEEFPARINLLFDRNITEFTHPETVVLLAEECMRYFLEAAGKN